MDRLRNVLIRLVMIPLVLLGGAIKDAVQAARRRIVNRKSKMK